MPAFTLEYRSIGLHPTCIGNERLRIGDDGALDYTRNTRECAKAEVWTNDWKRLGVLSATTLVRVEQALADSGLFALPETIIDEAAEGGTRQELDLRIGERECHLVVQNAPCPGFEAFVRLLRQTVADLEYRLTERSSGSVD